MGTPAPRRLQQPEAVAAATELVRITPQFKNLEVKREEYKETLRTFGPETYQIVDGLGKHVGTVQVAEAEVKTFKAKVLTVDQEKFNKLTTSQKAELIDSGVVAWVDTFTRDAKAKVETTIIS